jgi:hypothetical protein
MPITDPEILFHLNLSRDGRYKDCGRLALHRLPPDVESVVSELRDRINRLHSSIQKLFVTSLGTEPKLHFDFIDSAQANALAFSDGEWAFIGLTEGFLTETAVQLRRLVENDSFRRWLGAPPEAYEGEPSEIWVTLLRILLSFVWAHELGHHVYGHIQPTSKTFRIEATKCQTGSLEHQAAELDADRNATHVLLTQLQRDSQAFLHGCVITDTTLPDGDLQLRLLLASITSFLFSSEPCPYDSSSVYELTHPPRLIRIDFMLGAVRDWLNKQSMTSKIICACPLE